MKSLLTKGNFLEVIEAGLFLFLVHTAAYAITARSIGIGSLAFLLAIAFVTLSVILFASDAESHFIAGMYPLWYLILAVDFAIIRNVFGTPDALTRPTWLPIFGVVSVFLGFLALGRLTRTGMVRVRPFILLGIGVYFTITLIRLTGIVLPAVFIIVAQVFCMALLVNEWRKCG